MTDEPTSPTGTPLPDRLTLDRMTSFSPVPPQVGERSPASGGNRHLGFIGATGVGVSAIVGGGILVLAGVALQHAGPSAIVAFALNGLIAAITVLSFAELAATFPESGGAYVYARKVLGLRPAFAVGWVLWFAHIVAAVLYALGFAEYTVASLRELFGSDIPPWLVGRVATMTLAVGASAGYTASLVRRSGGGGELATWGKVVVFTVLVVAGFIALGLDEPGTVQQTMTPFFAGGSIGLLHAMGFTFIALQGFEIIGAVGGDVKDPGRTIPRAMFASLGLALVIYLPLLFVVSTAGVQPGDSISEMSRRDPATVMATAVGNYLGKPGLWLVLVAGVLSTLSALRANVLAASRVALTMARDRTLPALLGHLHAGTGTPLPALYATGLALIAILFMVPDLESAGAAASLIFLITFAMGHGIALLSRARRTTPPSSSGTTARSTTARGTATATPTPASAQASAPASFRAPFFPWLPVLGGTLCIALALFQAFAVPQAGGITAVWLGLGVLLYFAVFSARASVVDASALARNPELLRLRGKSPSVLVPIANPDRADHLVTVATSLAPPSIGKVLLLNVVDPASSAHGDPIDNGSRALGTALRASLAEGHTPRALMSVSVSPWHEIRRVAHEYRCHAVLLGAPELSSDHVGELEDFVNSVDSNVSFLFARPGWNLSRTRRIVVPIGGRGTHHTVRARVVSGILRSVAGCSVAWLRALPSDTADSDYRAARKLLDQMATDIAPAHSGVRVERTDVPLDFLLSKLHNDDLLLLGFAEHEGRQVFGSLLPELIERSPCACLVVARGDEDETLEQMARDAVGLVGVRLSR